MTTIAAIEATDLNVQKDGNEILHHLTFSVPSGTITGLIGPSGSGKTTLMRTIVGVQRSASGTLNILGQKAGAKNLRRRIGYVTQSPAVYGDLTVMQNVSYFGTLVGSNHNKTLDVISRVQLSDQGNQLVQTLSGGQKARVSLAIALLGDPDLLILDEPTVGLDPILRNDLWALFADMAKQGTTLLVSSHVMDEAERCDNLVLLRDGKLLWNDTKHRLLDHAKKDSVGEAFIAMIKKAGTE